MKNTLLLLLTLTINLAVIAQETGQTTSEKQVKQWAKNACKCVESVSTYNRPTNEVAMDISECLEKEMEGIESNSKQKTSEKKTNTQVDFSVDNSVKSEEYKKQYYELERYMMNNCTSLKSKMATDEKQSVKSFSDNPQAVDYYSKGMKETEKANYTKAAEYYEKAVKENPEFAFAWDNLGVCYRRLNEFDKAIAAYLKSLELDPKGKMPLQNLGIAYQYKKEYDKAIQAYEKLAELDSNNPEVYYGMGNVYASNLSDYENALKNMCKAYSLYVEQKSPYRVDAEKMIGFIYGEMKKQGKEELFNQILKENGISQN